MATAAGSEYVELIGGTSTLLIGSKAIRLVGYDGLAMAGPSRGTDLTYAQTDGADAYPRYRGSLAVTLSLYIVGHFDQDNVAQSYSSWVTNAWTLVDAVSGWPDTNNRECTLSWTRPDTTLTAAARFERFGVWTRPVPHIHEVEMLLTVPSGLLS